MTTRTIANRMVGVPTLDGAGVRLRRVFGFGNTSITDPFLLLDHFGSDNAADYLAGFPWHPHRGIETVTYMLRGRVEHGDSIGNKGVIGPGEMQWMTAGGGIVHQEMPLDSPGGMFGLQLWVNLPARDKMTKPRYRGIAAADITETSIGDACVKVIAGSLGGVSGPVSDLFAEALYLDAVLPSGRIALPVPEAWTVIVYVYEGALRFGAETIKAGTAVVLSNGDSVESAADNGEARFILAAGRPLREPVAWRGPIVMNTQEELDRAFDEFRRGTFVRS